MDEADAWWQFEAKAMAVAQGSERDYGPAPRLSRCEHVAFQALEAAPGYLSEQLLGGRAPIRAGA